MRPTTEEQIAQVNTHLARLRQLGHPAGDGWGAPWTEEELVAFEKARSCELPEQYRAFLRNVGDGGPGPGRGLVALRDRTDDDLAGIARPFPLTSGWVTPEIREELEGAELADDYAEYLYPLPDGTSADDGVLVLGATRDHLGLLLVVTGDAAGTLWTDNRGNDFEEVLPTGQTFLELLFDWLEPRLAEAEDHAKFEEIVGSGNLDALRAAFPADALKSRLSTILKSNRNPETAQRISKPLARLLSEQYAHKWGTAAQALVLGECWDELEALCHEQWAAYEAGELTGFRAEPTIRAHLAIAQIAQGKTVEPYTYEGFAGGYWAGSREIVPIVLSRWSPDVVRAVFEWLRLDVALEFIGSFPAESIAANRITVASVGDALLPTIRDRKLDAAVLGGQVDDVVVGLVDQMPDAAADDPEWASLLRTWLWLSALCGSKKSNARVDELLAGRIERRFSTKQEAREALVSLID